MTGRNTARAILAVRLFGFVLLVVGAWQLAGRGAELAGEIERVYLREFLLARVVTPVAAIAIGALLWAAARPLGRLLARGLDADGPER